MEIEGLKIVEAKEMALIESLAYQEGASEEEFMLSAGQGIAEVVLDLLMEYNLDQVYLIVGKGNNGGDAYVAGQHLLDKEIPVTAFQVFDINNCSTLCQKQHEAFLEQDGTVIPVQSIDDLKFEKKGLILDGILGTGFKGELKDLVLEVVKKVNHSEHHIVSIDIPSGVNGGTGEVLTEAVQSDETIFLGLPKLGFFTRQGFEYVGELIRVDFGLPLKYVQQANETADLLGDEIASALPPIKRIRHKYEAGYVLGVAGSPGMGGAAKLASLSALRSGAGIVKLFYMKEAEDEMKCSPLELVRFSMNLREPDLLLQQMKSAKSAFIGPGLGRSKETTEFLKTLLPQVTIPAVLDADCLYFISQFPDTKLQKDWILTPHRNEMLRLLGQEKIEDETNFLKDCQGFVDEREMIVVLKGAPTWIFVKGRKPLVMARGDPGMATAGTGDILTGIIASLLAQGVEPLIAASLGTYLHAVSGEIAALIKTSYSVIASDLIEALPFALNELAGKAKG